MAFGRVVASAIDRAIDGWPLVYLCVELLVAALLVQAAR
jgi:hypothetical protein